jgi:hypothetical protein
MPLLAEPSTDKHERARASLEGKLREDVKALVGESGDGLSGVCKGTLGGEPVLFAYLRHRSTLTLPNWWNGYKVVRRLSGYVPEHIYRQYAMAKSAED